MDIKTMNKQKLYNTRIFCVFFLLCFALIVTTSCNKQDNKNTAKETDNGNNYVSSTKTQGEKKLVEVVDLAGRTVTIPTGNVKVVLSDNFMVYAIAPLFGKNGNLFSHIIGWLDELEKYDPDTYEIYVKKFPEITTIPNIGNISKGGLSVENTIALKPDIVLMKVRSLSSAREMKVIEKFNKANIKTVFINFRKKDETDPTLTSMLLLGQIFGKTSEAAQFANFYFSQMQKVYSVVNILKENQKPLVFMESAANAGFLAPSEYETWGSYSVGIFVELAGGRNYGTEILKSKKHVITNIEQLLNVEPDVIIGTGVNWSKRKPKTGALPLGYKATHEVLQERLQKIVTRTGWQTLKAVKNKRVHNIWHRFDDSPYHFIAIQQIAKWLYPDKFADLNPEETFKEFHNKFLPIDYSGMFWASLE